MKKVIRILSVGFLLMIAIQTFGQNHFIVYEGERDDKVYTIINSKGEEIARIPNGWEPNLVHGEIGYFVEGHHVLRKMVDRGNYKYRVIDTTGRKVLSEIPGGHYGIMSEGLIIAVVNGEKGYVNTNGELAIPGVFSYANSFKNGMAIVSGKKGKGMINKNGQVIIPLENRDVGNLNEGMIFVAKNRDEFGFFDASGKQVIPFTKAFYNAHCYSCGRVFKNGLFRVKEISENNYFGYMDKKGELKITPQFDLAFDFEDGIAMVRKDNLYGFIDTTGNYIITPVYQNAQKFSQGYAWVKDTINKKWGLIDKTGNYLVDPVYKNYPYKKFNSWLATVSTKNEIEEPQSLVIGNEPSNEKFSSKRILYSMDGQILWQDDDCFNIAALDENTLVLKWERGRYTNNYTIVTTTGEPIWQPAPEYIKIKNVHETRMLKKEEVAHLALNRRSYYKRDKASLPQFDPEIWTFTNAKILHLDGQFIPELPADIEKLENLEELSLLNCGIESLPKSIYKLKKLKKLNLGSNRELKELPKGFIKKMKHLKELNVSGTGLSAKQIFELKTKLKNTLVIYR